MNEQNVVGRENKIIRLWLVDSSRGDNIRLILPNWALIYEMKRKFKE